MSDPQTNPDIEDVLSSIRRLVSEHAKPAQTARGHVPEDDAGRLVLTPALRVAEPERDIGPALSPDDEASGEAETPTERAAWAGDAEGDPSDPEGANEGEPALDLGAWAEEADSEGEDAGPTDQEAEDDAEAETPPEDAARDAGQDGSDAPGDDDAPDAAAWMYDADTAPGASVPPDGGRPHASLEATIAELEAVINRSGERWEPEADDAVLEHTEAMPWEDWTGDEEATDSVSAPEEARAHGDDIGAADASAPDDDAIPAQKAPEVTEDSDDPDWTDAAEEARAAMPDDADMSAAQEEPTEEAEHWDAPADPGPEPYGAHVHRLHGRPENIGYPDDEDELPPVSSEAFDLFNDDEAVLDEDMLRDLVAEIVRQELQGALGERITRNVRKLVRREIHRALASQELE